MPPLAALSPRATIIDKTRYSAFAEPALISRLRQREVDALIVSGSETDVCVLATVLDTVDIAYRVIVVRDAVCNSPDEDMRRLCAAIIPRYTEQIETAERRNNPQAVRMTFDHSFAPGVKPLERAG
jgi:nicotinamidase-related amidase